jgi:nitric oxide reductase NorQ protein
MDAYKAMVAYRATSTFTYTLKGVTPHMPAATTTTKTAPKVDAKTQERWDLIDAVLSASRRVLLRGVPGTGKTHAATKLGLGKRKVYTITMTEETPAAEIRGHFVPKEGSLIWMDGPAVRAWREGARLVINEIDHASADSMTLLFAILDDPEFAMLTLPTGETVRPAEGFQVIATMNGIPEDLPEALQDRFPVTLEVTAVNPAAVAQLPLDLQGPALATSAGERGKRISIRLWAEYANLREQIGKPKAMTAVFGSRAGELAKVLELQ